MKNERCEFLEQDTFRQELKNVYAESLAKSTLWKMSFEDFVEYQNEVVRQLGSKGFLMFTEESAIVCFKKAPDLKIQLVGRKSFRSKDFAGLNFGSDFEVIGSGTDELKGPVKQYLIDLKDNFLLVTVMTIIYLCIFCPDKINTTNIVALSDNLINVISIFAGLVFVFIGFIYSDKERAVAIFLRGKGDKYYSTDKYIMNLLMVVLFVLVTVSAIGRVTGDNMSGLFLSLQSKSKMVDCLLSYKTQYYICLFLEWFAICSIIICFRALVDYYLNDLRFGYFIDAVNKKSQGLK